MGTRQASSSNSSTHREILLQDGTLISATQTQHQVQRGFFLDVVVGQRAAVLQLLTGENQPLLVGRDACGRNVGM